MNKRDFTSERNARLWLRDESLQESDNVPAANVLAQKSSSSTHFAGDDPEPGPWLGRGPRRGVDDLEAALEQFREMAVDLAAQEIGAEES